MIRRNFLKSAAAAAALASFPFSGVKPNKFRSIVKPPRLNPGDTLGLIAPGSFITKKELDASVENIQKLGYNVYYTPAVLAKEGYLAGNDKQRADDIHEMFRNENVKGIICARGGYGCSRILPLLDYDLIRNNPKVLSGYSDITSLLYDIHSQAGLICFHGPVGISTFNNYSIQNFNDVIVSPKEELRLISKPEEGEKKQPKLQVITSGKAKGILTGGNLSIVVSMIGTPFDIDTEDKILFLEEIDEEPYRVDRMFTQMKQAGKFDGIAGIAMGVFSKCEPKRDSAILNSFSLMEVLFDRLSGLNVPVVYGMSFGHVTNKFTLPVGIEAELDADNLSLTLLEPAVI